MVDAHWVDAHVARKLRGVAVAADGVGARATWSWRWSAAGGRPPLETAGPHLALTVPGVERADR